MGSPPWRNLSTVEPLTRTMSSLPSLSQSKRPVPPLVGIYDIACFLRAM